MKKEYVIYPLAFLAIILSSVLIFGSSQIGDINVISNNSNSSIYWVLGQGYLINGTNANFLNLNISENFNAKRYITDQRNLGFNFYDDGSELIMNVSEVAGNNYFQIATDGAFFQLYANPNPSVDYLLATITEIQGADTEMNFYEGGTGHNRFWSSGSVRIGGSASRLCSNITTEVDCDTPGTGADLVVQDDVYVGGKLFMLDWSNITGYGFLYNHTLSIEDNYATWLVNQSLINGEFVYNHTLHSLNIIDNRGFIFNGSNANFLNVGIGTTTPSSLLHVQADDGVADNINAAKIVNAEATAGRSYGLRIAAGTNADDYALRIMKNDDTTAYMTVTGAGNVGIGTTSPDRYLHIDAGDSGDTDPTIVLQDKNNVNWSIAVDNSDSDKFKISTGNVAGTNDRLTIDDANGNVGIGTTTPSSSFTRSLVIAGAGSAALGLNDTTTGKQFSIGITETTSQGGLGIYEENAGQYRLFIQNTTGNVGIGTTTPSSKLSLGTDVVAKKLLLYDATNTFYGFGIQDYEMRQFVPSDSHFSFGTLSTADGTTWSEKVRIQNDGKVGIGTTTPSHTLTVNSAGTDIVANFTSTDTYSDILLQDPSGFVRLRNTGGEFQVYTDSDTYTNTIGTLDGKVGIGTTSPGSKLHIVDTTTTSLNVSNVLLVDGSNKIAGIGGYKSTAYTFSIFGQPADHPLYVESQSQYGGINFYNSQGGKMLYVAPLDADLGRTVLELADNGSTKITLSTAGDSSFMGGEVGIGTTSPDDILDIVTADPLVIIRDTEQSAGSAAAALLLGESSSGDALQNHWKIGFEGNILKFGYGTSLGGDDTKVTFLNDGNVGIGTTSPQQVLNSYGTYNLSSLTGPQLFNNATCTIIKGTTSRLEIC